MLAVAIGLLLGLVVKGDDSLCPNKGTDPKTNGGVNNYIIDSLDLSGGVSIPFPYAMSQCTAHSVVSGKMYYIHSCDSSGNAYTEEFRDSGCQTSNGKKAVSLGNTDQIGYYQCGGSDTYAQLSLGDPTASSCPTSLETVYAGLGACTNAVSETGVDFQFYCDTNSALVQWFSNILASVKTKHVKRGLSSSSGEFSSTPGAPTDVDVFPTYHNTEACDKNIYCADNSITGTCTQVPFAGQSWGVWSQFVTCTGTPDTKKGAMQMHISLLGIVVAAIVALFH